MKLLIILGLMTTSMTFIGHCDESIVNEAELSACFCFPIPVFNDQKIVTKIWKTEQNVARLSCYDSKTLQKCNELLTLLHTAYRNGEGLIAKDMMSIMDAVDFAAHKYQHRIDFNHTPYIYRALDVTCRLFSLGHVRDPDTLIAALTHYAITETDTDFGAIGRQFGTRVETFVRELAEHKTLPKIDRKKHEMISAFKKSAGAAQIVLADKLCKLEELTEKSVISKDRSHRYVMFTSLVVNALPWVNVPLKHAVDTAILAYWNQ